MIMENVIREAIEKVLGGLGVSVDFVVEHPADSLHGDYATNVAMVCAKNLGKSPREIAEQFRAALDGRIPSVARIEIAGAGFINFHLDRNFFSEKIADAVANPDTFGKNDSLTGEEIIFEYTSPNLMKPLHVGNLVGNIVGESVSRLLEWSGAAVRRVNYPSDIGLTVAKAVWGLKTKSGNPENIHEIGEAYRAGNEAYEDGSAKEEIESINRALYEGSDATLNALRAEGIETSEKHLCELCRMLGTTFNTVIYESDVSESGREIVTEHIGDVFEKSEGAIIYRGEKHGLHTRVFINSQGLPTYEAKDIGNFERKVKTYPSWTQSIVVTGGEQREYFKVLISALRELFPETKEKHIENIATGFLTLTTGKMSSRKGNVLTGEELLADVRGAAKEKAAETRAENVEALTEDLAVAALKYQILRQSVGSDIVFDKVRALSLEGDSGPYLEYTHARLVSVLEKAKEEGLTADIAHTPEVPYEVERMVYQFSEVVAKAERERAPHHLVTYLTSLASAINALYAHEQFVNASDEYSPYKIALASAVKTVLANGLYLLGIRPVEKM